MDPLAAIPWYKSSIFRNGIISALGSIAVITHIVITKQTADAIADLIVLILTVYFNLHITYTRAKKPIPPIALTQARADAANAAAAPPPVPDQPGPITPIPDDLT